MVNVKDFSDYAPTWCPGCGDWGINMAIKTALTQLSLGPSDISTVFDIGCSGNMNDYLNAYAIHSLHGRSIPTAIGMKLAHHKRDVLVIGGDGGIFGEGGNHFIHACRGNHDITVIVHDNRVYGLTTGQVAPTAEKGFKSKSTPLGIIEREINPLSLAITAGATFVAQTFAGNMNHVVEMIKAGITHKGFALVNVLQPCVTFNKINTYQYYYQRAYMLPAEYDKSNYIHAVDKSLESDVEKFPLGIIYQNQRPTFHESLPALSGGEALVAKQRIPPPAELLTAFE